ncbi:hypothetical protein GbCGDNIH2_7183 [Granulibacter bethesdensis]|nr:hypothetical protein GbCGDNIH2_7183 [Granulibacter bethesdensis]
MHIAELNWLPVVFIDRIGSKERREALDERFIRIETCCRACLALVLAAAGTGQGTSRRKMLSQMIPSFLIDLS